MSPRPRLKPPNRADHRPALHVLHVTAELSPLARLSGLGDVVGGLTAAQRSIDAEVNVVVPRYDGIEPARWNLAKRIDPLEVPGVGSVEIYEGNLPAGSPHVFLIDHEAFRGAAGAADAAGHELLCRAAVAIARSYRVWPDIVHLHGEPAAPAAALFDAAADASHPAPAVVLGVHRVPLTEGMSAALERADRITAASPRFADSLQREQVTGPLAALIARRGSAALRGIFNGVDEHWDPEHDRYLPVPFSAVDWSGKADCKDALQAELRLPRRPRVPLVGVVCPFDGDGGGRLLTEAGTQLWESEAQFAVLGRGDVKIEGALKSLASRLSTRVAVRVADDDALAHRITAGADFQLVPGAFDPGVPNQLYCLRYGTVPIVSAASSMADMVVDFDPRTGTGTAVVFDDLPSGIRRAVEAYRHPGFAQAVDRAMAIDLSWKTAARHYERVYTKVLAARRASAAS